MDSIEYHKLGFCLCERLDNKLQVQRIDEPEDCVERNGYDFRIPLLPSNKDAWIIATHVGFILDDEGYVLGKLRCKIK